MIKKLSILILFILICACGNNKTHETGQRFQNLEALKKMQKDAGFVQIGIFGGHWPATVTEIIEGETELEFTLKGGGKHKYPDYFGYTLQAIRLNSDDNQETVVVFRSE
ncbi:MAG: hypothetical protein HQK84_05055 [Nitrospinae bacterium]|nr:hypothetical protein [Nitrospinota bacterium]